MNILNASYAFKWKYFISNGRRTIYFSNPLKTVSLQFLVSFLLMMFGFFRSRSMPSSGNSAKVHSNSCSLGNESKTFGKQIQTASYEPGILDRAMKERAKDCEFCEEKNFKRFESSGNAIETFDYSANSLNREEKKSSVIQEANGPLNSNYCQEQSPEFLELDVTAKRNEVNGKLKRGSSLHFRTRSSRPCDGSFCSSDQEQQELVPPTRNATNSAESLISTEAQTVVAQKHFSNISTENLINCFQARNIESLQNWMPSENTEPSSQLVQFCCSERDDRVKILQEIDELKFELHRMFTKAADGKEAAGFSIKVTHFKGKVPSEKHQSSLIPLLGEPNYSSCRSCSLRQEKQILQSKHERPQTVKRHCRPYLGGAPFVICCNCFKLLQLPADFLLSRNGLHKLRCGFCSEVLKYTFRPRTRSALQTTTIKRKTREDENISLSVEE